MNRLKPPFFVGRHEEIKQLHTILDLVQRGVGRCVLFSGEAGIGKSRLLTEIRERAEGLGFSVQTGRCFEQDHTIPYAPLIDMLQPVFTQEQNTDLLNELGPSAAPFSRLFPHLEQSLSLSASTQTPELEKRRMFEALTNLFRHQAESHPLLLIIEDAHWSDQLSLEFLLFLVRHIASDSILLLITSRPLRGQAYLAELFSGLDREPDAQHIKLNPLSRNEVTQLIEAILKQGPSGEFVDSIFRLSEGNPFFAEEICASLIANGDIYYAEGQWQRKPLAQIDIPDSIQRVVERQLKRISPPARRFIDLAAISGRSFDFAVMKELTSYGEIEVLELVKELIAAGLVSEESANRFTFRHALTREALYGQLLIRERQLLHGQLVQAIEQVYAETLESHVEALAYHAYEAGMWEKTAVHAKQAGEKAQSLFAPHTAVEHFTRAINAASQLSQTPSHSLYRQRGQAFDTLGQFEEARADYETVLQMAQTAADQQATWQALIDLGQLWASRNYEQTGSYCQQALDLARTMEDEEAVGHSLNRLGNWLMNSGHASEAIEHHQEALALFEDLDDRPGIAETLDLLAMTSNQSGNPKGTVAYYERAISYLRELKDWQTLSSSLANLSLYTLDLEQAREAVKLARDIGWQSGEAYALNCLSTAVFNRGQYSEGLKIRQQSLELAQAIDHAQWVASNHINFGFNYIELMALTRAQKHLETGLKLAKEIGSTFFSWTGGGWLASAYIQQGKIQAAKTLLAEFPDVRYTIGFTIRLGQAELALHEKDGGKMLEHLEDVIQVLPLFEEFPGTIAHMWPLSIVQAKALLLLDRTDEAEEFLLGAVEQYEKHNIAIGLWRFYLILGQTYLAKSHTDLATEMFALAQSQIEHLAETIDEVDLRENFLNKAIGLIPAVQPPTPLKAAKQEYGGLTRRERQITAIIARGLTNQEIADELVVSIKTVEAHITRILSKLGFSSRAQIAGWAVNKGLAEAPQDLDSLSRLR